MIGAIPLLGATAAATPAADVAKTSSVSIANVSNNAIGDFGQMMTQVVSDSMDKLKTGEATAISGLHGKATVQQVVEAVSDAQGALQTALAVRDKVVSAYQEITRMTI